MAPASTGKRSAVAAATMAAAAMITALPAARAGTIVRGMDLCTSYARVCSDIVGQVRFGCVLVVVLPVCWDGSMDGSIDQP